KRAGLSLLDLQRAGGGVVRRQCCGNNRQGLLSRKAGVLAGSAAVHRHANGISRRATTSNCEVLLRDPELIDETVFKDVDLIDVDLPPKIGAVISHVSDLDNCVACDFTLQA